MGSAAPIPPVIAESVTHRHAHGGFALGPIDLRLDPGSFTVILGPNGSGKSTLVRLIGGVLLPESGRVMFGDRDARRLAARERGRIVAFVTQDEPRRAPFTVFEVVMMGRFPHQDRLPFDRAADVDCARAAMRRMGVAELESRLLGEISSGERQRVYLARALAQQPKILMLDEPAANLDVCHQVELYETLERLNKEDGLTVVSVSHELNVATSAATQVVLLKNGTIQRTGSPRECLTDAELTRLFDVRVASVVDPAEDVRIFAARRAPRKP